MFRLLNQSVLNFTFLHAAPSDPPRNVKVSALSSTTVHVDWDPPLSPNGIIQYYTVYYMSRYDNITETKRVSSNK